MATKTYQSPAAFWKALEVRIKRDAPGDINLFRRQIVAERFILRIQDEFEGTAILKGGLAILLRRPNARATKDIDIHLFGAQEQALSRLQKAGSRKDFQQEDFMTFLVEEVKELAVPGNVYGGSKFRVTCKHPNPKKDFSFPLDVSFAEPMGGFQAEDHSTSNFLEFARVPTSTIRLYPLELHIAEKLHAYTLAKGSSRTKDLPDMAILSLVRELKSSKLREALELRFASRDMQPLPNSVPRPPATWEGPYTNLARDHNLPWPDLENAFTQVASLLDPILQGYGEGTWNPETGDWSWS